MKKNLIKISSLALVLITMIQPISAHAFDYELDSDKNSVEFIEYQNSSEEEFTNETNVFAEIDSEYTVTIPKIIVLSGESKSAKYQVTANGDIAGYETVLVKPDNFVRLYSVNKSEQMANISQTKTAWKVSEFGTFGEGTINADGITAGRWSGSFNFNIGLDSFETIELENGKVELTKIEEEDLIQELVNDGYIQSAEQIDYFYEAKAVGDVEFPVTLTFNVDGEEGDQIAVYHHNGNEWEYITLATLTNGQITATFNSLSPIIFVNRSNLTLAPGLYDENDNLLYSWDELVLMGLDVEKDHEYKKNRYLSDGSSGYYIFNEYKISSGKLVLSNTVTRIGQCAFSYCPITEIVIPESVKFLATRAFDNCQTLEKVVLPDTYIEWDWLAFSQCIALKEINLSNTMAYIPDGTFRECAFETITFPDSLKRIEGNTFSGCPNLKEIIIPDSVTVLGYNKHNNAQSQAFDRCKSLEYVYISKNVEVIDYDMFCQNPKLKKVVLPDNLKEIKNYAFGCCPKLKTFIYKNIEYTPTELLNCANDLGISISSKFWSAK